LFAVTRVWSVQVTARPGLSDLRVARSGAALLPWLPALALVGLAAVGALLATRGWARRAVGGLLMLVGGATAAGVGVARAGLVTGAAGAGGTVWPVAAAAGGVLLIVGGWWSVRDGHRWPAMGARYERPAAAGPPAAGSGASRVDGGTSRVDSGTSRVDGGTSRVDGGLDQRRGAGPEATRPVDTRAAWDALDRGDDPTAD
jgi:hypothetical protein